MVKILKKKKIKIQESSTHFWDLHERCVVHFSIFFLLYRSAFVERIILIEMKVGRIKLDFDLNRSNYFKSNDWKLYRD